MQEFFFNKDLKLVVNEDGFVLKKGEINEEDHTSIDWSMLVDASYIRESKSIGIVTERMSSRSIGDRGYIGYKLN